MHDVTEIDFVKDGPTPRAPEVSAGHVANACEAVGMDIDRTAVRYNGRSGMWTEGRGTGSRELARTTQQGHILVITNDESERRFVPSEATDPAYYLRKAAEAYDPSDYLQLARWAGDWSQAELADKLEMSEYGQKQISEWESGDVNPGDETREQWRQLADDLESGDNR